MARGLELRYLLVVVLAHARRPLSTAEVVDAVHARGFVVLGRPSKTVSDALRWEVGKGRVRRLGRGLYVVGVVPRTTMRRMERRLAAMRADPHAWHGHAA